MSADGESGWTPRRAGKVYCSPRCGGGCTWSAYDKAIRESSDLCATLNADLSQDDWMPRVWENLGWHWEVKRGPVTVRRYERGNVTSYNAEVQLSATYDDPMVKHSLQFFGSNADPVWAVRHAVSAASSFAHAVAAELGPLDQEYAAP